MTFFIHKNAHEYLIKLHDISTVKYDFLLENQPHWDTIKKGESLKVTLIRISSSLPPGNFSISL